MKHEEDKNFHVLLKEKINKYVHSVYSCSKNFPKEELYGVTSQLKRSSLSIMLNYIEGYARGREKVHKNFLEISYGSLKESKYLLDFSLDEGYLNKEIHENLSGLADEIGAMLWGTITKLKT